VIDVPAVILCGGKGTRLAEETARIPKPMVTVGGMPVLDHLLHYYVSFGVRRFILCLGYKGEVIADWVASHPFTGSGGDVEIHCVDTGLEAMTGARVKRVEHLIETEDFFLTYGDGLGDVDLDGLLAYHRSHGAPLTVTAVHPPSRFGILALEGEVVASFSEKPLSADWINGGFFACDRRLFDDLDADDGCVLEREPFERLAKRGDMRAWRHEGYWQCMDTIADREALQNAWEAAAPWRRW
jgi:glucose-1-phosphate cytidylyltransferase